MLSTAPHDKPALRKRRTACDFCRDKKIRCEGSQPCANCNDRRRICVYSPSLRTNRRKFQSTNREEAAMTSKIQDSKWGGSQTGKTNPPCSLRETVSIVSLNSLNNMGTGLNKIQSAHTPRSLRGPATQLSQNVASIREFSNPGEPAAPKPRLTMSSIGKVANCINPTAVNNNEDSDAQKNPHWQYHGPSSFLSICSIPGIDWVSSVTQETGFSDAAKTLAFSISQSLTACPKISRNLIPEPDDDTAWRFCQAYFEHSSDAMLGVVLRPAFENRLRLHLLHTSNTDDDDLAWFALRNTVYASGCRIEMSRHAFPLLDIQKCSWRYFEKALSVHSELLFTPTGLMAVEALAAMSYYVEGIAAPSIEYMLCSSAVRLAQSKGLHRQASAVWDLSILEIERRNWLFWVIYIYEKHISSRSGRPSTIDDLDISCNLPKLTPEGTNINPEYFNHVVQHARISSRIAKHLATAQTFHQRLDQLMMKTWELHGELQDWRKSLPSILQPTAAFIPLRLPGGLNPQYIMYIRYAYNGSMMAIHSTFTLPWIKTIHINHPSPNIKDQLTKSKIHVAEAARCIILGTANPKIDAAMPTWLALYYPLVSMINLFVYTLQNPRDPHTKSDIALMEFALNHFSRVESVAPDISLPFAREILRLSRLATECCEREPLPIKSSLPITLQPDHHVNFSSDPPPSLLNPPMQGLNCNNITMTDNVEPVDLSIEDWGMLLPSVDPLLRNNFNDGGFL